jgi:hypothetical protein
MFDLIFDSEKCCTEDKEKGIHLLTNKIFYYEVW